MKVLIVAFAFIAVFNLVTAGDSSSSEEVLDAIQSKHLKKLIRNKGVLDSSTLRDFDTICPNQSENLKVALVSMQNCSETIDDSLTLCGRIQSGGLNCSKPVLDILDTCLPTKAKGLPTMGVEIALSVADFLCKQTGEAIFELFNPCLYEDEETPSPQSDECETKLLKKLNEFKANIPSQIELCAFLTSLRPCFQEGLGTTCKNPKSKATLLGLFDAVVAPCSSLNEIK